MDAIKRSPAIQTMGHSMTHEELKSNILSPAPLSPGEKIAPEDQKTKFLIRLAQLIVENRAKGNLSFTMPLEGLDFNFVKHDIIMDDDIAACLCGNDKIFVTLYAPETLPSIEEGYEEVQAEPEDSLTANLSKV